MNRDAPVIPGHTFERYLSSGGFGDVFAYRQDRVDRLVAVKVLRLSALTEDKLDEFRVEAARMAALEHDNIVRVYDYAVADDGRPYLSMEYCVDHLGSRAKSERISVVDVLRMSILVASAVDAAHRIGLFHRDIKPANVLVKRNGQPALTDFGIAGGRDVEAGARGVSLKYAAPEVIDDRSDGDELADIYSLGATTFTLLAGRSPHELPGGDNSDAALVARALEGVGGRTGRPDVPASLERELTRALSQNPASRHSSAVAYARALQRIETELGFAPTIAPFGTDGERVAGPIDRSDDDPEGTRFAPQRVGPATSPSRPVSPVPSSSTSPTGTTPTATTPAAADATQARTQFRPSTASSVPTPAPLDEAAEQPRSSRRDLVIGASAVVVVGLVAAMVLLGGSGPSETPQDLASAADTAPVDTSAGGLFDQPVVPRDVQVIETADGAVEVTWTPDPTDDATYVVSITSGPQAGTSESVTQPQLSLDPPEDGQRVCVRVLAVVSSTSSEPSREECTP